MSFFFDKSIFRIQVFLDYCKILILFARPYELSAGNDKSPDKWLFSKKIYKFWLFSYIFF